MGTNNEKHDWRSSERVRDAKAQRQVCMAATELAGSVPPASQAKLCCGRRGFLRPCPRKTALILPLLWILKKIFSVC